MAQERRKRQTVQFTFARKSEVYRAETQAELDGLSEAFGKTLLREGESLLHVQGGAEFYLAEVPDPPPPAPEPEPVETLEAALAKARAELAQKQADEETAVTLPPDTAEAVKTLLAAGRTRDEVAALVGITIGAVRARQAYDEAAQVRAARKAEADRALQLTQAADRLKAEREALEAAKPAPQPPSA